MTTKLLNDDVAGQVRDVFQGLQEPVEVFFFGAKENCVYCDDTRQLVEEIVELSDLLGMQIFDLEENAETARQYNVDKVPGLVLLGRDGEQLLDYGIRYAGIPSGHEFSSLINDLVLVSGRDSGLDQETRQILAGLNEPVLLQVYVTPT
jgi:glutaredoxin-like protein